MGREYFAFLLQCYANYACLAFGDYWQRRQRTCRALHEVRRCERQSSAGKHDTTKDLALHEIVRRQTGHSANPISAVCLC